MKVSEGAIFELFPKGNIGGARRDHWVTDCPFCEKNNHFYIRIKEYNEKQIGLFDCKKCSIQGNIDILLLKMNRRDLLDNLKAIDTTKLKPLQKEVVDGIAIETIIKEVKLPIGYKRIFDNTYLELERNFSKQDFLRYEVGTTPLIRKYEGYVIFPVYEFGRKVGYVCRNTIQDSRLRYINSDGFQKASIFYGLTNQVMFSTAFVVEGIFDKKATDGLIDKYDFSFRCLATFGKSISVEHILKLKRMGVTNLIVGYDADAIKDMKKMLSMLIPAFPSVLVCDVNSGKDIDNSSSEDIYRYLTTLRKPQEFFTNKLISLRN